MRTGWSRKRTTKRRRGWAGSGPPRRARPSRSGARARGRRGGGETRGGAVILQGRDPKAVLVDLGRIEAILPPTEQVPCERYVHGERLKCYVLHVRKGFRGPSGTLSRTHPSLVRKLFELE